jgi:hypothetical protein
MINDGMITGWSKRHIKYGINPKQTIHGAKQKQKTDVIINKIPTNINKIIIQIVAIEDKHTQYIIAQQKKIDGIVTKLHNIMQIPDNIQQKNSGKTIQHVKNIQYGI